MKSNNTLFAATNFSLEIGSSSHLSAKCLMDQQNFMLDTIPGYGARVAVKGLRGVTMPQRNKLSESR